MSKEILRIAPSPTGKLHIGTIRTAYFNWLIAQQNEESKLILRIDDTDLKRSQQELIDALYKGFEDLGITYDETFRQSEKFSRYKRIADQLVYMGYAVEDDGCIRLNKDRLKGYSCDWWDQITRQKTSNDQIDEFAKNQVIIKSDGSPAYNFASVLDDIITGVTWVVRGVDHISNTYKQVLIYRVLGEEEMIPKYSHVGLVCHRTGKKLSKRDSDELNLERIDTEALLNYVLRLGWSPYEDTKKNNIIDRERAIELFLEGGKMKSSNAKIDLDKLDWYNKKYSSRYERI